MFVGVFYGLAAVCGLLYFYTRSATETNDDPKFKSFQRTYLIVYMMAVAGDWLQGPHVYALYESYGMSKHQIEILFIAGFGSSLIFGTFIGSIADKFGRRNNCLMYAILYGGACITKHFGNMPVLMIGRFLGGVATSILYSAFESWLIFEHNTRGFSDSLLGTVFSNAALANSLIAIISGVAAQFVAERFGFVAPFDLALSVLLIMGVIIMNTWPENYGNEKAPIKESFEKATKAIKEDPNVFCLGLVQSLFEGSMYTFVLEWTPALSRAAGDVGIPHGYIFAAFMVATMIGSSVFKLLQQHERPESFMRYVLLLAAVCLSMPIVAPDNLALVFGGFLVFEMCCGIFWPSMGCLRGTYVSEETRSTTLNLFRIPLNLIVIFILWQNFAMISIFKFCVFFLFAASIAQHALFLRTEHTPRHQKLPITVTDEDENM
ncbi:hypothetical protein GCK72_016198 [Caenorhabditis remanei]|uniref:Major facilitator superfamily (MFS) profile domain-containing protein n=1 Tax=Caenorhabditis remanei TaxID=31234 RepID=A0A6A5GYF2_CAERE|nr:hypothetical protein GCK72_016198 [Caenorhabditis remanei]KAF1759731.1 hypothetical protein GCK72_016198 [Caenorhabditis remanei]